MVGALIVVGIAIWVMRSSTVQAAPTAAAAAGVTTQIPFVGCESDGQGGSVDAPPGSAQTVTMTPDLAKQLAYYKAENGAGGLGPAGWHCFGTYGSSGTNLYISPQPIADTDVFSGSWKGLAGPAIQISISDGGTSGRFDVAAVIARVFPSHRSFTQKVVAEGVEPASSFPKGPYPSDKLTYVSDEVVEFITPANVDGLGTHSQLLKGDLPIEGVAILYGTDTSLLQVSMELPANLSGLAGAIVKETEREVALMKN